MEVLTFIALAALFALIIQQNSRIAFLQHSINRLEQYLQKIQAKLDSQETKPIQNDNSSKAVINPDAHSINVPTALTTKTETSVDSAAKEEQASTKIEQPFIPKPPIPIRPPVSITQKNDYTTPAETISWFQKFKQNNPDIEKFIGENLINKIGIFILVLGIGYFVKYAIDREWINEHARVGIGIFCGATLIAIAHKLRFNFKAFSSVFVAGGIAVFYLTIGIAFHEYHLFSQTVAFLIMVLITIFSTFVSLQYNRQELAILSLIGGFGVPFFVSTVDGNYHVLFTYIALLNASMLTIAYFKRWNWVNFTSFVFTMIIYIGWYSATDFVNEQVAKHAFLYSSLFYILFAVAFVLNNTLTKSKFSKYEIGSIIINTFIYYGYAIHTYSYWIPNLEGLFTLSLAIFNLLYAFIIFRKHGLDQNVFFVLIGIALTMATITIPTQFKGEYITLFWACEAVLLFWLTQKSNMKGFVVPAIIVQFLSIISLILDWQFYDSSTNLFLNGPFLTGVIVVSSLIATYRLFKKYDYSYSILKIDFNPILYRKAAFTVALALAYLIPFIDLLLYYREYIYIGTILYAYHILYTSILVYFGTQSIFNHSRLCYYLVVANICFYILFAASILPNELYNSIINENTSPYGFFIHLISVAGLIFQFSLIVKAYIGDKITGSLPQKKHVIWFFGFVVIYFFTKEIYLAIQFNTNDLDTYSVYKIQYVKVILPIIWGILSFIFLLYGIRRRIKLFRIIALTLLGITVLKLFIYDIANVSETGKIIAFILLGILILIISFMYQKIKKMVVDPVEVDHEKDSL